MIKYQKTHDNYIDEILNSIDHLLLQDINSNDLNKIFLRLLNIADYKDISKKALIKE